MTAGDVHDEKSEKYDPVQKSVETLSKVALYMISNFVLADRVQSMAGMSISVGVETRKNGKNYLKRKV